MENKSLLITYLLWMFGGIFGLHHFYLKRDRHAFVWWTTLGGYVVGWFIEVFMLPKYVRDVNGDPTEIKELISTIVRNKKASEYNFYCTNSYLIDLIKSFFNANKK